jgi:DNA repair exonuclease SbcCD ATPase subunit
MQTTETIRTEIAQVDRQLAEANEAYSDVALAVADGADTADLARRRRELDALEQQRADLAAALRAAAVRDRALADAEARVHRQEDCDRAFSELAKAEKLAQEIESAGDTLSALFAEFRATEENVYAAIVRHIKGPRDGMRPVLEHVAPITLAIEEDLDPVRSHVTARAHRGFAELVRTNADRARAMIRRAVPIGEQAEK